MEAKSRNKFPKGKRPKLSSNSDSDCGGLKDHQSICRVFNQVSTWNGINRNHAKNHQHSSKIGCFVCGNATHRDNSVLIYSRVPLSRPDVPIFPFLEYHDPAPGADAMMDDWSVISCFVCNAFLCQQWESFQKSCMPINKRLYWLKRPSGCEIRQPVSQIELEEILNERSRDNYKDYDSEDEEQSKPPNPPTNKQVTSNPDENKNKKDTTSQPVLCYACGQTQGFSCNICTIHCKPSYEQIRSGIPYYPSVLKTEPVEGVKELNGLTTMCILCLAKFKPEWHNIQMHFLKQEPSINMLPRVPLSEVVGCFKCGKNVSTKSNEGLIHTDNNLKLISKLDDGKAIDNSVPLTFGFTYLCKNCYSNVMEDES